MLFLEPFDGGSHRAFARGWKARSRHAIEIAALPARFWKWRVRGAGLAFAERFAKRLDRFDAVVATSLLNAADFAAATRLDLPLIVYFHENQLSYPRPPGEPLDHGLALASLASASAADAVVFNSTFHRDAFFRGLEEWVVRFPENAPAKMVRAIRRRSTVIRPGIDWQGLAPLALRGPDGEGAGEDGNRRESIADTGQGGDRWTRSIPRVPESPGRALKASDKEAHTALRKGGVRTAEAPLILWNHRWEFDKNAPAFFWALDQVAAAGRDFRVALLGENTQVVPTPFLEARERLGARVVHYGFVPSEKAYRSWLGRADIIVSTSKQENFGIAVTEAVAAGAFPLLPSRLAYPEVLPERFHEDCLYRSQNDLVRRLDRLLAKPALLAQGRLARSRAMRRYDWKSAALRLDAVVEREIAIWIPAGRAVRRRRRLSVR